MTERKRFVPETTSASLHIMAMAFMLCDHLWGTVVPGNDWLTCIGRLTFPIYAFLIVEGYFHTSSLKRYLGRLLLFAVISEVPFNLAMGSRVIYPVHQNVLWTFLIGLLLIHWNERNRTAKLWKRVLVCVSSLAAAYIVGLLTAVDYYHAGVLTVLVFYYFRGRKWWCFAGQAVCLWYICSELLGGYSYEFTLLGKNIWFVRQNLALLALAPIWMYRGKQGYSSKWFKWLRYSFYPVHLLILGIIKILFL